MTNIIVQHVDIAKKSIAIEKSIRNKIEELKQDMRRLDEEAAVMCKVLLNQFRTFLKNHIKSMRLYNDSLDKLLSIEGKSIFQRLN